MLLCPCMQNLGNEQLQKKMGNAMGLRFYWKGTVAAKTQEVNGVWFVWEETPAKEMHRTVTGSTFQCQEVSGHAIGGT